MTSFSEIFIFIYRETLPCLRLHPVLGHFIAGSHPADARSRSNVLADLLVYACTTLLYNSHWTPAMVNIPINKYIRLYHVRVVSQCDFIYFYFYFLLFLWHELYLSLQITVYNNFVRITLRNNLYSDIVVRFFLFDNANNRVWWFHLTFAPMILFDYEISVKNSIICIKVSWLCIIISLFSSSAGHIPVQ